MSFLVKRGTEKDNFYNRNLNKVNLKQSYKPNRFSDKEENLLLIGNVTGKVSKGFVTRDENNRIVNRLTGKS